MIRQYLTIFEAIKVYSKWKPYHGSEKPLNGYKDAVYFFGSLIFPIFLFIVGKAITVVPIIGFIGYLWMLPLIGGNLFVSWIFWPCVVFWGLNVFIQLRWYKKDVRKQIFENSDDSESINQKIIQIFSAGLSNGSYIAIRTHLIYISLIIGLLISNLTTSRIHYVLTGNSDAFIYYDDIPYFREKSELYENLSSGILGSQRIANLAKDYCNADLISWDICNELEIYYEMRKEGGNVRLDKSTNEYLKDFFKIF